MNLLVISAAVAAASFMVFQPAKAETVNTIADLQNNKKTAAYVNSRTMYETMFRLGVEQDRKFGLYPNCKSQYLVKPFSVAVFSPIDFPDDKRHPIKGVWQFRYQLERCGDSKFYNALFIANGTWEAPTSRAYYPGSTHAGPLLVKDAMMAGITGAMVRSGLKDCKDVEVFDMRVTEPAHDVVEGGRTKKGIWNEAWTFRVCGQAIDVPMTFIPDAVGGGTTFMTSPMTPREGTGKPRVASPGF